MKYTICKLTQDDNGEIRKIASSKTVDSLEGVYNYFLKLVHTQKIVCILDALPNSIAIHWFIAEENECYIADYVGEFEGLVRMLKRMEHEKENVISEKLQELYDTTLESWRIATFEDYRTALNVLDEFTVRILDIAELCGVKLDVLEDEDWGDEDE